jgi:TRAP transporter TAXI family solute receptor
VPKTSRIMVCLVLALVVCGMVFGSAEAAKKPAFMLIGGGSSGGTYLVVANLLAQLLTKNSDIRVTAQATTGGGQNVMLMGKKDMEMGIIDCLTALQAKRGEGQFEGRQNDKVRAICGIYAAYAHQLVRSDAGISSMSDLIGRRLVVGGPASGTDVQTRAIYSAHGIDYSDISPQFLGISEGVDQIRNKLADGITAYVPYPFSSFVELTITNQGKLISLDKDAIERLTSGETPFAAGVIPAKTYTNQPEDIYTVGNTVMLAVRDDVDEEIVYEFTKCIFENLDWLRDQHHAFTTLTLENAANGLSVPVHPGAARYYKEVGIIK